MEGGTRAGTQALTLLSAPIVVHTLEALADGPQSLIALRHGAGSPPQTTMRAHLRTLTETDVVVRRRESAFPGSLDFELTGPGRDLWALAGVLRTWLATSPEGPIELGSSTAKSVIRALVEGWNTNMVRALAVRPFSLTELDSVISGVSYPSLERRLGGMRMAGQIAKAAGPGRGTPYGVTEWLRRAVAPIAAASRWERLAVPMETAPSSRLDVEAAFLLAVPLITLPPELSGSCRMAVEVSTAAGEQMAGVVVSIENGRPVACSARLGGEADAWASGSPHFWMQAVIDREADRLEIGGDCDLARALLDGLHDELFGVRKCG